MAVHYLDQDDEITGAVARLRSSEEGRVAIVLPPGSRLATSRMNFRLLAREAQNHRRQLAIVTPDENVRALAVSAGLPAHATVIEYERGLLAGDDDAAPARPAPETGESRGGPDMGEGRRPRTAQATPLDRAAATAAPSLRGSASDPRGRAAAAAPTGRPGSPPREPAVALVTAGATAAPRADRGTASRGAGRRGVWVLALLLLAGVLATGAAAAVTVLPTATIRLTPRVETIGPVQATVVADPAVTAVDAEGGVIPARSVPLELAAARSFAATGVTAREIKATGRVRFSSENTVEAVSIPAGTEVSTGSGVAFVTTQAVVVPRATFDPPVRGVVHAPIEAARGGPAGNVEEGAIDTVPRSLRERAIAVTNSAPTEGGQRIETRFVSADDYVDAVAELRSALDVQLAERLADPDALQPGLRVFPATARRGTPAPSPEREAVVGDQATEFRLTLKETAAVTAVDEARLQALAAARLRAALPRDRRLLDGSLETTHEVLATTGGRVQYRVEASGEHWHPVDARALLSQVKGKSIAGARQTLERYGEVQIDRWPDYVDTIPSFGDRASLVVAEPQPGAP